MVTASTLEPAATLIALAGPRPRVVVAFSGGIDSTVLAHALMRARRKLGSLRLAHVDHGLQSASADWARHCARLARAWHMPFVGLRARIDLRRGDSPEAAARDARYASLASAMEAGEVLVTAQHQDDQVETLLLQLFRGAGVAGLAAMPAIARFGPGRIARPLLGVPRAEIEMYARAHHLRWVEDPSNALTRFGRNYLRHRVLPEIRARWQGVDAAIVRCARHMAEAGEILTAVAKRDLDVVADGDGLNVAGLRALPSARRRNAVRSFIARAGLKVPSSARMVEILATVLVVRADAQPEVRWDGCTLRRRAGRLELQVNSAPRLDERLENLQKSWDWATHREFIVNGAGDALRLIDDVAGPIDLDRLPKLLHPRARAGGETIRLSARARAQSIKKLMQAMKLPVDARTRIPLLYNGTGAEARLVIAGDRWVDASIAANVKSRRRARLWWIHGAG